MRSPSNIRLVTCPRISNLNIGKFSINNLKLKVSIFWIFIFRQSGQGTIDEVKGKDFKKELEEREYLARLEKEGKHRQGDRPPPLALPSSSSSSNASSASKKARLDFQNISQIDADAKLGDSDSSESSEEDSDESDDEDDTQALLAELNRIKRERAEEEARQEEEKAAQQNKIRMENILSGNPLLNAGGSSNFKVKRRWDDDVVFKNCAKNEPKNKGKNFINDTLRSEFHKKFMNKYIK